MFYLTYFAVQKEEEGLQNTPRVFFLPAEVIGWCWPLPHFQQTFPICQVGSLIFSFSFSLIQISSMRTWRWGQMGRATRLPEHPLTRCSHPQVSVWGTEGTDASLQRWDLLLCVADAHCSSTGLFVSLNWQYVEGYDSLPINKCLCLNMSPILNDDTFIPSWLQQFALQFVTSRMV